MFSDFLSSTFFCRFPDFGETVKAVFFLADLFRQGPTGRLGRFLSAKCRLFNDIFQPKKVGSRGVLIDSFRLCTQLPILFRYT
jgi:hypothetical protein